MIVIVTMIIMIITTWMPWDLSIQRTRLSDLRTRVRFRGRGGTSPDKNDHYDDDDDDYDNDVDDDGHDENESLVSKEGS